ncbi:MAG: hypothetical protein IIX68_02000 [Clostridia bacterium]|nr:hypothetical protein [Clostridia bacterium]
MRFDGLIGNAELKEQLSSLVDNGRLPHALLIEGPSGSGRKTLATLLAKAAVCRHSDGAARPCGVCPDCIKADAGTHPDISFYGGSDRARSFSINTVRELREEGYRLPNEAACRVFILENAQALTLEGQNALLRIIEEPPKHLRFILTCRSRFELLETIRSRTFALTLGGVGEEEALPWLRERFPGQTEEDLRTVTRLYGACLGTIAEALADSHWKDSLALAPSLAEAILAPTESVLLAKCAELPSRDPALVQGVLRELRLLFRDALTAKYGQSGRMSPSPQTADKLAASLTAAALLQLLETVEALETMQRRNINHALFITEACAKLRAAVGR